MCKRCLEKPVITLPNSNVSLCRSCFIRYFEKKTLKTIRKYKLIEPKDKIIVAISGGKDSLSILNLLNKLQSKRMNFTLSALLIDEGIKDYRDQSIKDAKTFCKNLKIPLKIVSFKKEIKCSLDQLKKLFPETIACSMCGVLRRYFLNKSSRELKATKLATGHNLDDEAQTIFMNQLRHNISISARLGPKTGVKKDKRFIPRIKPFYLLTEKEVATYAYLHKLVSKFNECPYSSRSNRFEVRDILNNLEQKYPGSKHSIVASFLEILPLLKQKFKGQEINSCNVCKEPTSSTTCTACQLIQKLK